jgi:regulator of protease activity HflC (stomatin/prohibitin superfamily)
MMHDPWLVTGACDVLAILFLIALRGIYTVRVAEAAVVMRLGRFHRVVSAGAHWMPPIDWVGAKVDLRTSQMTLKMATRTKDGVVITIPIAIETRVNPEMVYEAWSKLHDPGAFVRAQAEELVLGRLRSMTLDELFASQTGIAGTLRRALDESLNPLGYEVVRVQVTGTAPNNLEDARRYTGRLVETGSGPYSVGAERARRQLA